jgi:hypothetical protein
MSKLDDLLKLSESNKELMSDLEALDKRIETEGKTLQAYEKELTEIAGNYGISLSAGDFIIEFGELDDSDLAAVAGGLLRPRPRPYADPLPKALVF